MPSIPFLNPDVIHHIIVMLSSERDSEARLATMALLSRSCAHIAQPYLFQSIMVQDNLRCHRLFEVFESNPKLVTCVKELEMVGRVGYDYSLESRDKSFSAEYPTWYITDEGGKLLGLLSNVAHLSIHGVMLHERRFDDFMEWISQFCYQPDVHGLLELARLLRLVVQFPRLEKLCFSESTLMYRNDPNVLFLDGWWPSDAYSPGSKSRPPRLLRMQLAEINAESRHGISPLPEWFVGDQVVASLEELDLGACCRLRLSSIWEMAKNAASTLTALIIPSTCVSGFFNNTCYPKLVLPRLQYLKLCDQSNVAHMYEVIRILTSLEASATLRHLILDRVTCYNYPKKSPHKTYIWTDLDNAIANRVGVLDDDVLHVQSVPVASFATSDTSTLHTLREDDVRRAMPRLEQSGRLRLLFNVPGHGLIVENPECVCGNN
jgi:hypothetical protein